jgi:hypothetical protein
MLLSCLAYFWTLKTGENIPSKRRYIQKKKTELFTERCEVTIMTWNLRNTWF